jgi:peptidyl-prolyl cis-trans isomerase D
MATLEKIRSKIGVIAAVVIGLALLSFILQDLFSSRSSLFSSSQYEIAKIGGKSIPVQEYEQKYQAIEDIYKMNNGEASLDDKMRDNLREQVWQQVIQENVLLKDLEDMGLGVGSDELFDLIQGKNPHPFIQQIFRNPETGELNHAGLLQFWKRMDEDPSGKSKAFGLYLEKEISTQRTIDKYNTMVIKGLYVTKLQAKNEFSESNRKVNFRFIALPYSSIPDQSVKISESDLKAYYKKHKYQYEQIASRDIEYVSFNIIPAKEDSLAAKVWIDKIKDDFVAATNSKEFAGINSDVPFDEKYYKQSELPDTIKKIFDAPQGTIIGPFIDNGFQKLAKLEDVKMLADSVKARHILIKPATNDAAGAKKAKATADSLFNLINNGADFAELAKKFGTDGTASKGGDLGWFKEGQMVKPFNDFCFFGKKGERKVLETQFGYHVAEITDKGTEVKKVQVVVLARNIAPSENTRKVIYQQANLFAGNNRTGVEFDNAAASKKLDKKIASYVQQNDKQIAGLESSRELIRWAYKAKKNEVSEVIELSDKYLVAVVSEIREKGFAPLAQVRSEIENKVRLEKKAEMLIGKVNGKLSGVATIDQLAASLMTPVQEAADITFSAYAIPTAGIEPNVIATATNSAQNKLTKPIQGTNAVYVLTVTNIMMPSVGNLEAEKGKLNYTYMMRANYESYEALKKAANINDQRYKFY